MRKISTVCSSSLECGQQDCSIYVCTEPQETVRLNPKSYNWQSIMDVLLWPSSQRKTPSSWWPKKPHQAYNNSNQRWSLFDIQEIVHQEFVPPGSYQQQVWGVWGKWEHKQPEMQKNRGWVLHHDNVHACSSLSWLVKNQHDYCPPLCLLHDLVSSDICYIFPKVKFWLKGQRFHSEVEIQVESADVEHTNASKL